MIHVPVPETGPHPPTYDVTYVYHAAPPVIAPPANYAMHGLLLILFPFLWLLAQLGRQADLKGYGPDWLTNHLT